MPNYITRLIILTILAIAGVAYVYSAIPPKYIDRDLHKRLTVERESERELSFAGGAVCAECHDEAYEAVNGSYHADVSCEVCHGPAYAHTEDEELTPSAPRERKLCPLCHLYDPARPTGFPQINPVTHNPMEPCINCHDAHDPTTPQTPEACAACHAEIASTKSLSHHALLECTMCHEAPEEHKITPRVVRPTKPKRRAFCGLCHAEDAIQGDAPKVDIVAHGEKYLCWQCHFAHMPEVH
jgi:hypothetical protein